MFPSIRKWISVMALPVALFAPALLAGDLSTYRGFQFGMDLSAAVKRAEIKPSDAKMVHQRPAVIQDLSWRPPGVAGSPGESDTVKDVLLSFYNGKLFRVVANYDRYKTEGMTTEDVIGAVSVTYGVAAKPIAEILFPSSYSENVKVIARWEDAEFSVNLVQSPYQPSFALVSFSKQLNDLAQAATVEAIRLDAQEAPQREADQRRQQADEVSAKQEKARLANKPSFRP